MEYAWERVCSYCGGPFTDDWLIGERKRLFLEYLTKPWTFGEKVSAVAACAFCLLVSIVVVLA